jgi:hypothetical protein
MGDIKRMSVKEFRELGLLQEVNRQFLHPLGLALEVYVSDDGEESFGGVWDYRDDPEGMVFGQIKHPEAEGRVEKYRDSHAEARKAMFGQDTIVQPLDWEMGEGG